MTIEPQASFVPGRIAAIDIGTVTCRMLVADVDERGGVSEVDREYAITNLGEGVDASGVLKPEAIERTAATVERYLEVRDGLSDAAHPVVATIAMATSASRDARNAREFASRLAKAGVELSVIPGDKEAALSFSGASCDFAGENIVVADVGGGSTEIVVGRAGEAPAWAHSFDIGCRRVTEKFVHDDPPTPESLQRAREWVREGFAAKFEKLGRLGLPARRLVAVAGTATTVVAVREGMTVYDPKKVHRSVVTLQQLDEVLGRLAALPLDRRQVVPGLDPGRAPVIVAGLVILQEVMRACGLDAFTVSETDILHGIVLDAARRG